MESSEQSQRKLLIIKSHAHSLGPVEGFLRNRDWDIKSTANLKEALVYLVQNQPQFVMISIDHPNRKVRNLPKVLSQALPVCVIAFAENSTAASVKILSDCAAGYAIFHPVTGPAVERMVNKYYKDLQTNPSIATHSSWNDENNTGKGSGVIAIRGEGSGGNNSATQNFLANLMGSLDGNAPVGGSHIGGTPTGGTAGIGGTTPVGMSTNPYGGDGNFVPSTMPSGQGSNFNPSAYDPAQAGNGMSALNSGGSTNPLDPNYQGPQIQDDFSRDNQNGPGNANRTGWAPSHKSARSKYRPGQPLSEIADEVANAPDSLILKGTREAMDSACIDTKNEERSPLEDTSHVACIMVESARFSGYLVAAMAPGQKVNLQFIEKIRSRLFRFLRENGEKMEDNESMPIKIKEVPFAAWAVECAEFLRKSVHEGNEVAMAFFPRTDLRAQVELSADQEMAAVKIEDLHANAVVEFNVYIYLPRNNRYVLYTPCGGVFFTEQKERLKNQGVSHLHVLRMELASLDKYRAQNFLNDKIEEFEARDREKIPV